MKKRVYNIKGKRLVEGDIDSITKEEMHVAINEAGKVELSTINDSGEVEKVAGGSSAEGADGMWMAVSGEKVFVDLSSVKDGDSIKVSGFNSLSVAEDITDEFEKVKYGFVFKQNEFENELEKYGECSFGLAVRWSSATGNSTSLPIPVYVITPQAVHAIVLEVRDLRGSFHYADARDSLQNYYSDEE